MSALHSLNPKAEHARRGQALEINIGAAEAIAQILSPNFGPNGLLKLLVGGAGDLRISKDGAVLLEELPIAHPSAALISRTATAMDDVCGDGTTSCVLFIGELLRQARRWLQEGVHPRVICDGYEKAKEFALKYLDEVKQTSDGSFQQLLNAAKTVLGTKIKPSLTNQLAEICVNAVLTANKSSEDKKHIDLHMIEVMTMQHQSDMDSCFVNGIVCDHGWRYDELKCSEFKNCHILTLNVTLEYEKTEVNSQYYYKNSAERVAQAEEEREYIDIRVRQIIKLCNEVRKEGESFVILNMKGVDQISLQMFAEHNIMALRRVKRRNLERLTLACGGNCLNTLDNLSVADLGYAGKVYEKQLGEEKFTFVEDVKMQKSCTILLRGPNKHTILQLKDAVRDGLRAVKNHLVDAEYVGGAGAFETGLYVKLLEFSDSVLGKPRLGVLAYADAILQIPKTLARNAGFDSQDAVLKVVDAQKAGKNVGLDIKTGEVIDVFAAGIIDQYRVKYQLIHSATTISSQMLLVDEILRAGRAMTGGAEQEQDME